METSATYPPGENDSPREVRIRKAIAVVAVLGGAGWVASAIIPAIVNFSKNEEDGGGLIFLLTMVPLLTIPGLIGLWYGYQLFLRRSEESLRPIVGIAVLFLIGGGGFYAAEWLKPFFPEGVLEGSGIFLFTLAAAVTYPWAVSWLLPVIGGEKKSPRSFISKGMLTMIAFLFFFSLSSIRQDYLPLGAGMKFTDLPILDGMIDLLIIFSPMLAPYIGYRIAVWYFFSEER